MAILENFIVLYEIPNCTNFAEELLIIVEFCRFGNLHNYLLKGRGSFINQINPETVKIDYGIDQQSLTNSRSDDKSSNQSSFKHTVSTLSDNSSQSVELATNDEACQADQNLDMSSAVEDNTILKDEESAMNSDNNNIQTEYNWDSKENCRDNICTKDLLTWAFQVARGMEYLASRKILHGDLAARNILLADNNIVKICDFGLAKNMYMYDNVNYIKKGDDPLPVKWMAIESIKDRIFSTQSDVWSFGIILWEFFSLAETPYPGMEADDRLYQKLSKGYRMESPQFAPKEIYMMMIECWSHQPLDRPSFNMLSVRLGCLLEDPVRQHYIDLNDPYLLMNTQQLNDGEIDYLALLKSPTFEVLTSPQQVTEMSGQKTLDSYQNIRPDTIHNQLVEKDVMKYFKSMNQERLNMDESNAMNLEVTSQRPQYTKAELNKIKKWRNRTT